MGRLTKDQHYSRVARGILDYLMRDMTHPEGGIYSAEVGASPLSIFLFLCFFFPLRIVLFLLIRPPFFFFIPFCPFFVFFPILFLFSTHSSLPSPPPFFAWGGGNTLGWCSPRLWHPLSLPCRTQPLCSTSPFVIYSLSRPTNNQKGRVAATLAPTSKMHDTGLHLYS